MEAVDTIATRQSCLAHCTYHKSRLFSHHHMRNNLVSSRAGQKLLHQLEIPVSTSPSPSSCTSAVVVFYFLMRRRRSVQLRLALRDAGNEQKKPPRAPKRMSAASCGSNKSDVICCSFARLYSSNRSSSCFSQRDSSRDEFPSKDALHAEPVEEHGLF